ANEFIKTSSVTFANGEIRDIQEHWFVVKTHDTEERDDEGQKLVIDSVEAFGNVTNLSSAIASDESGKLATLVEGFKTSSDPVEKSIFIKKILYFIAGADTIVPDSRGGVIDARELHVIEQFMGQDFVGAEGTSTPNSNAAKILKDVYFKIENMYLNLLNLETDVQDYINMIYENVTEDDIRDLDTTIFVAKVLSDIRHGKDMNCIVYGVESWLYEYDNAYGTSVLNKVRAALTNDSIKTEYIDNAITAITVIGNESTNHSYGTNSNEIFVALDNGYTVNASGGNDIIYGGSGNDTINAGSGDDVVYGDEGDDKITGGDGNDILYDGDGDDIITGDSGNDMIYGGIGNDTLIGGIGEDILYAEGGNDTLDGGEGNDILCGGDGDDSLNGGTGDDMLYGDAGNDTYYINADHGNDTIHDSEGFSMLVFGDELGADDYSLHIDINNGISLVNTETGETIAIPDFINMPEFYEFIFDGEAKILGGGDSRQIIEGTDEDDVITGGDGFNIIKGNSGNDIITGGDNFNFIYGGDGDDTINGGNGTNRGENGDDVIRDGGGDGYLDGGDGNDTIYGGDGNDVIIGGAGADELHGENGDDVIAGNDGDDVLYGEDGNDTLFGGDGDDILYGDAGDDYIEAGNGTDTLYGGTGNDTFVGGEGINYMYGEEGDDTFYGGNALNYMYGGDGDDNFTGGDLADYIEGGAGNDTMNGGNGNNEMYGGDGDDTLYGNDGNDILDGGTGNDTLCGGNGTDTYIFAKGYGNDTINEWGSDHSIVKLTGINSDEVTITDQWGSNLVVSINETEDTLIISNFKWGQATFSFEFADGAIASVNKDTWELEFSKLPDIPETSEDDLVQENADILNELYADDSLTSDILTETDSTVISDISDSVSVNEDSDEVVDQTDIQVMILTENMSAFADEDNVFDNTDVLDSTNDMSMMNQLLVGSQVQ
ncbi:MAG: hypothetical protein K2G83_01240, partial [Ruminococcus sp.]|nr:hypothetical protein [Ruminococcus sp.]